MDQSARRKLIDQLRCQYWSTHDSADGQNVRSTETDWPPTRPSHHARLINTATGGAGRCAVGAEYQYPIRCPDSTTDHPSRPPKQQAALQPTHKGPKGRIYTSDDGLLRSHFKKHQLHQGFQPQNTFQRPLSAVHTAHKPAHKTDKPGQPVCVAGNGRKACGASNSEGSTELSGNQGVTCQQQFPSHHDCYNSGVVSSSGPVTRHEHLKDSSDSSSSSSGSNSSSKSSSADTISLRSTDPSRKPEGYLNSSSPCSNCSDCCSCNCSFRCCSCRISECSSSSICDTADNAGSDTLQNLDVAFACIETAAPAFSFSKASRWPNRTQQQQQQVLELQSSSSRDRIFNQVQHSTAEADNAFAVARNVLRAAAAANAAAAEEAYDLARQIISWEISQPAAAAAGGGGGAPDHTAYSTSSSSSKPSVIDSHLRSVRGPVSFSRMTRFKENHHQQRQQQQQQQQPQLAHAAVSLDLIKPKAAAISFAHPSVRDQMQHLLKQRQQQKTKQQAMQQQQEDGSHSQKIATPS